MEGAEDQECIEAVEFINTCTETAVVKKFHAKYFNAEIVGLTRFKQLLNSPGQIRSAHDATKREFKRVARVLLSERNSQQSLYVSIAAALNIDHNVERYVGSYYCYRKSDDPERLIKGTITILRDENSFQFRHESTQTIGSRRKTFSHHGPVFVLSNRLYLVGIGNEEPSAYIRPIILRAVDNPKKQPLVGMLLTETEENVPFASLTVLIHTDHESQLQNELIEGKRFDRYVHGFLDNKSNSPHILYGWSRPE